MPSVFEPVADTGLVPNHITRRVGPEVQKRINALQIGQKMQDLPEELWHASFRYYVKEDANRKGGPNLRLLRLRPDAPSLTVTGYIFNKFVHPTEDRFISVREAARLQGLPDSLFLRGTLTSTQMQVGNAVPVPLARAVLGQVVQHSIQTGYINPLSALSLFSGAGGMDIGAEQTGGIETKVALDNMPDACETLRGFHQNKAVVVCQNITAISDPVRLWRETTGNAPFPDLVYGGPPCQSFSQAGKQKGFGDDRGQMLFEFLRFVRALQPRYFVMENVANLKGTQTGALFSQIVEQMQSLNYHVQTGVLLAADWGTPQLRRRLFFVGCHAEGGKIDFPSPTHQSSGSTTVTTSLFGAAPYATVAQAFAGLPPLMASSTSPGEFVPNPKEVVPWM